MKDRVPRIAIIISHPIQHFCPQYTTLAKFNEWEIKVFFASAIGLKPYKDPGFGQKVQWDGLQLDFPHEFLNEEQCIPIDRRIDAVHLEERLKAYNPSVLIIYGYSQRLQRRALDWGHKHKKAVLMFSDSENHQRRAFYKRFSKRLILPRIYRKVSGFLTTGDANEAYYRLYGVKDTKMFRAPYPIDRDHYEMAFENRQLHREEIRAKLKIPDDHVVCSVVGKLVRWKRQKDLILSLPYVANGNRKVTALIIGTGEDEQELRRLAETVKGSSVVFSGFVQPVELPKYYAATDIYVHLSSREPHSVAISEAIYMGCPVIISDRCGSYGPTDDVQPGRNGLVYTCGDVKKLGMSTTRLANDGDLLERFSHASRAFAVRSQTMAHGEGLKSALTALGYCN